MLVERLRTRNEFYIESHHPLRQTIIEQTGRTEPKRTQFLQQVNHEALLLGEPWLPDSTDPRAF